ncbi:MAG: hypothetical protein MRY32_00690 [Rickettsiales bacterium]|nr:hypothetical protein [Rickettsiales bacterium]
MPESIQDKKKHQENASGRRLIAHHVLAGRSLSGEQLAGQAAGKMGDAYPQLALKDLAYQYDPEHLPAESVNLGRPVVVADMDGDQSEQKDNSGLIAHVRDVTPAWIVNNGARYNFGVRLVGNLLGIWSGLRPGSESYPRAAAGLLQSVALTAGLVYNEKPMTRSEQERLNSMSVPEYVTTRVKNAFDPKNHITATVGLATLPNGFLHLWSGYRQHVPGKIQWEMVKGGLTILGGLALNMIPDQEKAWQVNSGIYMLRAPTSFMNAHRAYFHGVPEKNIAKGDWQQMGKLIMNQSSNVFGIFYGGVHKDEEGNIIHVVDDEFTESTPDYGVPGRAVIEDQDVLDKALSGNFLSNQSVAEFMNERDAMREQQHISNHHSPQFENKDAVAAGAAVAIAAGATGAIIKDQGMPHTAIQAQKLETERLEDMPAHLANGASNT